MLQSAGLAGTITVEIQCPGVLFGDELMATDKRDAGLLWRWLPKRSGHKQKTQPSKNHFDWYCSPEFTQRLLEHMHRAKKRAVAEAKE